jgi:hypothetical protein
VFAVPGGNEAVAGVTRPRLRGRERPVLKLVIIYGAPGVGKLTTAKALAALTGFKLFHNHLSFDLVKAVFDFPTPPFSRLLEAVRLAAFEAAAREKLPGIVFTFVYAAPDDDGFVQRMIQTVERNEGHVAFVHLICETDVHEGRVVADNRRQTGKITTVEALRRMLTRSNLTATIPWRAGLEIDNSALRADEVARRIVDYFSLPVR